MLAMPAVMILWIYDLPSIFLFITLCVYNKNISVNIVVINEGGCLRNGLRGRGSTKTK